jgi:hypothetical protein
MAQIRNRRGRGNRRRPERRRHGRDRVELAGVLSKYGFGLGFRWEKYWEIEKLRANLPRAKRDGEEGSEMTGHAIWRIEVPAEDSALN